MPSNDTPTRRRLLTGLGTAFVGGAAGCSGQVPGTGPATVETEATGDTEEASWEYPPVEDGGGIGYASVEYDGLLRRERPSPAIRLELNSTVGGLTTEDRYEGYSADWFRFSFWPPTEYRGHDTYEVRVQPPGQWEGFSAYYDYSGVRRRFVVELREMETPGTILVPAVFDPAGAGPPARLECSFTVQASRPGPFGQTVRAGARGTLLFREEWFDG